MPNLSPPVTADDNHRFCASGMSSLIINSLNSNYIRVVGDRMSTWLLGGFQVQNTVNTYIFVPIIKMQIV